MAMLNSQMVLGWNSGAWVWDLLVGGFSPYPSEKWWSESQLGWRNSQLNGQSSNSCSKPPSSLQLKIKNATSQSSQMLQNFRRPEKAIKTYKKTVRFWPFRPLSARHARASSFAFAGAAACESLETNWKFSWGSLILSEALDLRHVTSHLAKHLQQPTNR